MRPARLRGYFTAVGRSPRTPLSTLVTMSLTRGDDSVKERSSCDHHRSDQRFKATANDHRSHHPSTKSELRGSRDVAKLCLGVQALCHLAALGAEERAEEGEGESAARENPPARELATHALLALLVNRYPRVRRVAAEQLYVTLLGMDGDEYGGDAEAAAELLSDTRWDAELAVVKPARNELYPLLGLVAPANATAAPKGKGVAAAATDENESYAALVGSAGY